MSAIVEQGFLWATLQTPRPDIVRDLSNRPWSSYFIFAPIIPEIPEEFRPIADPNVRGAVERVKAVIDRLWPAGLDRPW